MIEVFGIYQQKNLLDSLNSKKAIIHPVCQKVQET